MFLFFSAQTPYGTVFRFIYLFGCFFSVAFIIIFFLMSLACISEASRAATANLTIE